MHTTMASTTSFKLGAPVHWSLPRQKDPPAGSAFGARWIFRFSHVFPIWRFELLKREGKIRRNPALALSERRLDFQLLILSKAHMVKHQSLDRFQVRWQRASCFQEKAFARACWGTCYMNIDVDMSYLWASLSHFPTKM